MNGPFWKPRHFTIWLEHRKPDEPFYHASGHWRRIAIENWLGWRELWRMIKTGGRYMPRRVCSGWSP